MTSNMQSYLTATGSGRQACETCMACETTLIPDLSDVTAGQEGLLGPSIRADGPFTGWDRSQTEKQSAKGLTVTTWKS